jgi:hypothetical protein
MEDNIKMVLMKVFIKRLWPVMNSPGENDSNDDNTSSTLGTGINIIAIMK